MAQVSRVLPKASTLSSCLTADSDGLSDDLLEAAYSVSPGRDSADDSSYGGMDGGETPMFGSLADPRAINASDDDDSSGVGTDTDDLDSDELDDVGADINVVPEVYESGPYAPVTQSQSRFLDRAQHFRQSLGQMNIKRTNTVASLYALDWFHSMLDLNTTYIVLIGFSVYVAVRVVVGVEMISGCNYVFVAGRRCSSSPSASSGVELRTLHVRSRARCSAPADTSCRFCFSPGCTSPCRTNATSD
jgi:hypothetical protein